MEEVVCDICLKEYDENVVVPRVLECGHSICSECIKQLIQTSPSCPKCRNQMSHSSYLKYVVNYSLIGISNSLKGSSTLKSILQRRIETLKKQYVAMETKLTESKLTVDSNLNIITDGLTELQQLADVEDDDLDLDRANNTLLNLKDKLDIISNMKVIDYFKLANSANMNLSDHSNNKEFLFEIYNRVSRGERFCTVTKIADQVKYGNISVWSDRLFIHAFSTTEVDQGVKTVWFQDVKESLKTVNFRAFLEIICNDQGMRRMVLIEMRDKSLVPQFLRLCTGESGPVFKGSPFFQGSSTITYSSSVMKVDKFMENGKEIEGSIEYFANSNIINETFAINDVVLTGSSNGSFQILHLTNGQTMSGILGKVEEPLNLNTIISHGTQRSIFDSGIALTM